MLTQNISTDTAEAILFKMKKSGEYSVAAVYVFLQLARSILHCMGGGMFQRFLLLALIMLTGGCSATPLDSSLSPDHPASLDAPESPYTPSPGILAEDRTIPRLIPEYQPKMQHQVVEAIYVCSMHANIVQNAPGKCPRCGMSLVRRPSKKGLAPDDGEHHE